MKKSIALCILFLVSACAETVPMFPGDQPEDIIFLSKMMNIIAAASYDGGDGAGDGSSGDAGEGFSLPSGADSAP